MSLTNASEISILKLIMRNENFAAIGDATGLRGSSAAGNFHIALHTGDPGETGSFAAEASYGGYGRVAVSRATGSWATGTATSGAGQVSNAAAVTFGACTSGSATVTHFSVVTASTGGTMIKSGALGASLAVSAGITPEFAIGALKVTAD